MSLNNFVLFSDNTDDDADYNPVQDDSASSNSFQEGRICRTKITLLKFTDCSLKDL